MRELRIDPELKNLIPPLTPEEFRQLEENIVAEGCRDALVVWNGTIVDGHNRYEICREHGVEFRVVEKEFASRDAVEDWIDMNQLGRRNLTPDQMRILRGRRYNRAEKRPGARSDLTSGNDFTRLPAAEKIAKEHGVTDRTIKNDGKFYEELEKYKEKYPEQISEIYSGKKRAADVIKDIKGQEKTQKKAETLLIASQEYKEEDVSIYFEEFQKGCERIPDESVDAIITDPPYPIEYISLWEDMFATAVRILKPSAFLVAYANHQNLDKIFQLPNPLKYYWIFKLDFTAKPIAKGRNLIATWKPVLVYQKPPFKKIEETIEDNVKESKAFRYEERTMHEKNWGQSLGKLEYLVEKFTSPGDLVVEPFAGTGTTLVACKNLKRKCIGFETEKEEYESIIKGRIVGGI